MQRNGKNLIHLTQLLSERIHSITTEINQNLRIVQPQHGQVLKTNAHLGQLNYNKQGASVMCVRT